MKTIASLAFLASTTAALLTTAPAQAAGADACGNLSLTSIGECHFEFSGGCKAKCEPLNFVAACDGQCNASVEASCNAECSGSCLADCNADPGSFNCRASCTADCQASVRASCEGEEGCESYAEANCSAKCESQCEIVPPSASCEAECNGCCTGSCDVEANFDCSLNCSAKLDGGCEIDCEQPEGALFCDGQYIAVTDLPECVAYLVDNFEVNLEFEAHAEASADLGCSASGEPRQGDAVPFALGLGLLGFAATRRRRRS